MKISKKIKFNDEILKAVNENENNIQEKYLNSKTKNLSNRVSIADITKENDEESNYLQNVYNFIQSPLVKFAYHKLAFLAFLIFFSYYVLCNYPIEGKSSINWTEVLLIMWVYSFSLEAIQQYYIQDTKLFLTKVKFFLSDYWNIFDLIAIIVFTIGIILRFIPDSDNCFQAGR